MLFPSVIKRLMHIKNRITALKRDKSLIKYKKILSLSYKTPLLMDIYKYRRSKFDRKWQRKILMRMMHYIKFGKKINFEKKNCLSYDSNYKSIQSVLLFYGKYVSII
jgi:hypothetical protein